MNTKSPLKIVGGIGSILSGLGAIAGLIYSANWNFADPAWATAIGLITAGVGLIYARGQKDSSEDVGIK